MATANASPENPSGLPPALRTAQAAVLLPEVQAMLCRLSEYGLGIFMPHTHSEHTGQFEPLPEDLIQVESGLQVSFEPLANIADHTDRFLPVGWLWRAGASAPVAACEMVREEGPHGTERYDKHKMPK